MTNRQAKKRRLERAGYVYVAGWLPRDEEACLYDHVQEVFGAHLAEVEQITAEPPRPRGRPPKS